MSETRTQPPQISDHIAFELVAPLDAVRPFGAGEILSDYLYRPMKDSGSADPMIGFIDYAERFIDTEYIDSQYNHTKILRIACLVQDIPEELPLDERARAWRHLLNADWVLMFGELNEIEGVIRRTAAKDPELGDEIRKIQFETFQAKATKLDELVGEDERVPRFARDRQFDFGSAMDGYDVVRDEYPEALLTYNSLVVLAMSDHRMRGEDEQSAH
jgi:hypothetical protein